MKFKCDSCKEFFNEPKIIDEGIGPYEYWGATGYHSELVEVSPCCEEDFSPLTEKEEYLLNNN